MEINDFFDQIFFAELLKNLVLTAKVSRKVDVDQPTSA